MSCIKNKLYNCDFDRRDNLGCSGFEDLKEKFFMMDLKHKSAQEGDFKRNSKKHFARRKKSFVLKGLV